MDWKTCTDKKEKYQLYLQSREWAELRNKVRERASGLCERCKKNKADAVHHLTYARKYNELLSDLQAICEDCHSFIHGHADSDPVREAYFDSLIEQARSHSDEELRNLFFELFMTGLAWGNGWKFALFHEGKEVGITCPRGNLKWIAPSLAPLLLLHDPEFKNSMETRAAPFLGSPKS